MPKVMPKIECYCEHCGKTYFRYYSAMKNYKHRFCSRHCKAKWIGKKLSQDYEYKEKCRQIAKKNGNRPPIHKGKNHWNWKGGISNPNRGQDYKYIQWRKDVLAKDNFTCQFCSVRGGKLSSHHIVSWSECEELRYEVSNGQCLCYDCHMRFHGLRK